MLTDDRHGHWTASCDKRSACGGSFSETIDAASFEDARKAFATLGWLECARSGKGQANWDWWCPKCNPQGGPIGKMPTAGWT